MLLCFCTKCTHFNYEVSIEMKNFIDASLHKLDNCFREFCKSQVEECICDRTNPNCCINCKIANAYSIIFGNPNGDSDGSK